MMREIDLETIEDVSSSITRRRDTVLRVFEELAAGERAELMPRGGSLLYLFLIVLCEGVDPAEAEETWKKFEIMSMDPPKELAARIREISQRGSKNA